MCPLSGILNGCPRLRPTLVPDSLTSAQRGLIRVVRTRLFEQLRELVKSCPGLGANNTIGHECVSALKGPQRLPISTQAGGISSRGAREKGPGRGDAQEMDPVPTGVTQDADGNVYAAEGPNSLAQAGGAFTKYSVK